MQMPGAKEKKKKKKKKEKEQPDDLGQAEVQAKVDELEEQGFMGTEADPTPNENYTVDGVTAGKPTPETDAKQRAKAREVATLP